MIDGLGPDGVSAVSLMVGKATGSTKQQIKGAAKQVVGKTQKGVGNARASAKDADRGRVR